jgi:hypothetical protein
MRSLRVNGKEAVIDGDHARYRFTAGEKITVNIDF